MFVESRFHQGTCITAELLMRHPVMKAQLLQNKLTEKFSSMNLTPHIKFIAAGIIPR